MKEQIHYITKDVVFISARGGLPRQERQYRFEGTSTWVSFEDAFLNFPPSKYEWIEFKK